MARGQVNRHTGLIFVSISGNPKTGTFTVAAVGGALTQMHRSAVVYMTYFEFVVTSFS